MANANRATGLRPVKHTNGSAWNGQSNLYFVPATDANAMGIGDLVSLAGSASPDGYATVVRSTAGTAVIGVVVGFYVDVTNLNNPGAYRPASTARYVMVTDSPDTIYEAQEDAVGGALAVTDVGLNVDFIVGAPSATTGLSGTMVDTSTKATTATLPLKIIGFVNRPDNEIGTANAKIWVQINNHQLASGTGVAGV